MYDLRDLGTFAIMVLVLPLFIAVFAIMLALYIPFAIVWWLFRRLSRGPA